MLINQWNSKIKWQESLLYFLQMQTKFAELSVKDEEFSPKSSSSVWWALGLQVVTCIRLSTGGSVVFLSFRYKLEDFLKFFCMKRMWISSRLFMSAKPTFCWRLSAQWMQINTVYRIFHFHSFTLPSWIDW